MSPASKETRFDVRKFDTALPAVVPSELAIGLEHLDSDFCWCDTIIEVDDNGQEIVLHKQVTWN